MFRFQVLLSHAVRRTFIRKKSYIKQQIAIRKVGKNDFDKVMSIRPPTTIYGGADYLPDYFYMLLETPNVEMYAAMLNNQFVAFEFVSILDGGKTIVTRGGRVSEQFEGQGIPGLMWKWLEQDSLMYEQRFTRHAVIGVLPGSGLPRQILAGRFEEILRREIRFYKASSVKLKEASTKSNPCKSFVGQISEDELGQIFKSKSLCDYFFKEGRVIADVVPYRLETSNAPLIMTERTTCVLSKGHDSRHNSLLTFGSYARTPIGLLYNIELYGCLRKHVQYNGSLKQHLQLHMRNLYSKMKFDDVLLRLSCESDTCWRIVSNVMQELGFELTEGHCSELICAERELTLQKTK